MRPRRFDEKSAGAIVFHARAPDSIEYLLILSTYWGFPKGWIDNGEKERDAARREIREETGLEVTLLDGFREQDAYTFRSVKRGSVNKRVTFFLAQALSRDVTLSWEHSDYAWLSYDDALARLQFDQLRVLLKKANAFLTRQKEKAESSKQCRATPFAIRYSLFAIRYSLEL